MIRRKHTCAYLAEQGLIYVVLAAQRLVEVNSSGPENLGRWVYHNNQRTNNSVSLIRQICICGCGGKQNIYYSQLLEQHFP